jgi:hypothetical protein
VFAAVVPQKRSEDEPHERHVAAIDDVRLDAVGEALEFLVAGEILVGIADRAAHDVARAARGGDDRAVEGRLSRPQPRLPERRCR